MPFNLFNSPELGITPWRLVVLFVAIMFLRRIPPLLMLYRWVPEISGWREALFCGHFGKLFSATLSPSSADEDVWCRPGMTQSACAQRPRTDRLCDRWEYRPSSSQPLQLYASRSHSRRHKANPKCSQRHFKRLSPSWYLVPSLFVSIFNRRLDSTPCNTSFLRRWLFDPVLHLRPIHLHTFPHGQAYACTAIDDWLVSIRCIKCDASSTRIGRGKSPQTRPPRVGAQNLVDPVWPNRTCIEQLLRLSVEMISPMMALTRTYFA